MSWRRSLLLTPPLALLGLALCGALPGELNGCDTDLTDEVDHRRYCRDRCEAVCAVVTECGLYLPPDDPPEGATIQELCQADCEELYLCSNPQLCPEDEDTTYTPYSYISVQEAETCLSDLRTLVEDCDTLRARTPYCGTADFGESCPTIETCEETTLCDPPEWE